MEKNTKESTLLQEASPVSLTRSQVKDLLQKIHEIYGEKCIGSFAKLNPNGSWLKTSQGFSQVSLGGTSEEFLETWPKRGIVCNGFAFQLQRLELGTKEREFGLLRTNLIPTPTACEAPNKNGNKKNGPKSTLQAARENWTPPIFRTPTASEGTGGPKSKETMIRKMEQGMPINLRDQVAHPEMFPTPTASEADKYNNLTEEQRKSKGHYIRLCNTVSTKELESGRKASGQLNLEWVEWLMGFPIGHTELKD